MAIDKTKLTILHSVVDTALSDIQYSLLKKQSEYPTTSCNIPQKKSSNFKHMHAPSNLELKQQTPFT